MKHGKTLSDLAGEIYSQKDRKWDVVVNSEILKMGHDVDRVTLNFPFDSDEMNLEITKFAHGQLADRLDIPKRYYDRLLSENPALLSENVNYGFKASGSQKRLIRTLDGRARAVLTNKFRPLDNYDLLEVVLPLVQDLHIESCDVTDTKLYLKAVDKSKEFIVKDVGDVVCRGICISNSEVGAGLLSVDPFIFTLKCLNGAIGRCGNLKQQHVGKGIKNDEDSYEFFRDDTRLADDRAMWLKVRDTVSNAMSSLNFQIMIDGMSAAYQDKIEKDPVEAVTVAQKVFSLSDGESNGVLKYLLGGGDLSRYGMLNAVTRMSQDVDSYDRATELEKLGGNIITLPKKDWKTISEVVH